MGLRQIPGDYSEYFLAPATDRGRTSSPEIGWPGSGSNWPGAILKFVSPWSKTNKDILNEDLQQGSKKNRRCAVSVLYTQHTSRCIIPYGELKRRNVGLLKGQIETYCPRIMEAHILVRFNYIVIETMAWIRCDKLVQNAGVMLPHRIRCTKRSKWVGECGSQLTFRFSRKVRG